MNDLKKILSFSQLQEVRNCSNKTNSIPSLELMEDAANAIVKMLMKEEKASARIRVVCGTGLPLLYRVAAKNHLVKAYVLKNFIE